MFNPVAFLMNVKIKDMHENLKPFLDEIEKDHMILEELAQLALDTVKGCLSTDRHHQFEALRRVIFLKIFSKIVSGYKSLTGMYYDGLICPHPEYITSLPKDHTKTQDPGHIELMTIYDENDTQLTP